MASMIDTESTSFKKQLRACQIIAGALVLGLLNVCAIGVLINLLRSQPPAGPAEFVQVLSWAAVGVFCVAVLLSVALSRNVARLQLLRLVQGKMVSPSGAEFSLSDRLIQIFQGSMIVGFALLEGAGFFGAIVFLIGGNLLGLAVAAAAAVAIIWQFPTANRIRNWITAQAEVMEQLRRDAPSSRD